MTTALDIITDALQELGVVGAGDAVEPEDAALGLRRLNQILQTWANSPLSLPVLTEISVTLTTAQEYTIGPSGGTVALRPVKVVSATALDTSGNEHPVGVINDAQWAQIFDKSVSGGAPLYVWYEATSTNGTAHVYPIAAGYTLVLRCQALLTSFASTGTAFTLPEGYEAALYLTLAQIPEGCVVSYGELAHLAGLGRAARWVGRTLSQLQRSLILHNPLSHCRGVGIRHRNNC